MPKSSTKPNNKARIRVLAFFLMLFVPFLLFIPQTGYVDLTIINIEKRTPTPLPSLATTPLARLPPALEEYVGDRVPYRHQLIRLQAALNYKMFGTIESTTVMLGQSGWLFSKNQPPAQNQSDYQGLNHFTPEETAALRAQLEALTSRCAAESRSLVLLIGPNKESICSQYMPTSVPVINNISRADALVQNLQNIPGLQVVWPKPALLEANASYTTYYKYDTHWNHLGAYIASRELFSALGINAPPLSELPISTHTKEVPVDLANLSGIYPYATDDVSWDVGYNLHITAPGAIGNEAYTSNAEDPRNILIMRDSFTTIMMPFINRTFSNGNYIDISTATYADITTDNPDIVILQLVERNLHLLPKILDNLLA